MDRAKLFADLARDEGTGPRSPSGGYLAYKDTLGYWTIGIGHLLGDRMRMSEITEEECQALFAADAAKAEDIARRVLDPANMWHIIDDVRQRALINMAFNRGERHMRESTMITPAIKEALIAIIDHDIAWKKVGEAIRKSPWAAVIGKRAERLAYMLETGKDPNV